MAAEDERPCGVGFDVVVTPWSERPDREWLAVVYLSSNEVWSTTGAMNPSIDDDRDDFAGFALKQFARRLRSVLEEP